MDEEQSIASPWINPERYVTPYLPDGAKTDVAAWRRGGRSVVHWVVPEQRGSGCRNCQGLGVVYLAFLNWGPSRSPSGGKMTYVEGTEGMGTGWYGIEEIKAYECPHCHGAHAKPESRPKARRDVTDHIRRLADEKSLPAHWAEEH